MARTLLRAHHAAMLAGASFVAVVVAAQQPPRMTADRLLREFATPLADWPIVSWMPNGRSLVLAAAPSALEQCDKGHLSGHSSSATELPGMWIAVVDAMSGRCRVLARGANPKPSPDGRWIAYVAGSGVHERIALIRPDGSNQRTIVPLAQAGDRVTPYAPHIEGYDFGFAWSPDAQSIAYCYRPSARQPERVTANRDTPTVREVGGRGDVPPNAEVWVVRVDNGAARKVLAAPKLLAVTSWFLDGQRILLTALGSFAFRNDSYTGEVWAVDVNSGDHRVMIKDAGVQNLAPRLSPDGVMLAFNHDSANIYYPEFNNLALIPVAGGRIRDLTHNIFVREAPVWSETSSVFFLAKEGGFTRLFVTDTLGRIASITSHEERDVEWFALAPNGKQFVVITQDLLGRVELSVGQTASGTPHALLDLAPQARTYATAEAHEIRWRSPDSTEIAGYLIKPLDYRPGQHYPLLVDIHGGPVPGLELLGSVLLTSPVEWQMWAAKGYVVLIPDYRASAIPGWDKLLETRERQDICDRDFDDIMAGVDRVVAMGLVDTTRMAVLGHSYGSAKTNWIVTHTHRFRAAVSYEGFSDERYAYGTGFRVGGNVWSEWMHKGKPWEVPEGYRRNSSMEFVKGVTTPTLFINASGSAPIAFHTEYLYTAWKQQGVEARYLIYEGEGHTIQQPANQRDLLMRVIEWIDSHVNADSTAALSPVSH